MILSVMMWQINSGLQTDFYVFLAMCKMQKKNFPWLSNLYIYICILIHNASYGSGKLVSLFCNMLVLLFILCRKIVVHFLDSTQLVLPEPIQFFPKTKSELYASSLFGIVKHQESCIHSLEVWSHLAAMLHRCTKSLSC